MGDEPTSAEVSENDSTEPSPDASDEQGAATPATTSHAGTSAADGLSGTRLGVLIVIVVAVALIGGGLGALVARGSGSGGNQTDCDAVALADEVMPAVVTINVSGPTGRSNGTGELIRSDGYILTNDHVIFPGLDGGSFTAVLAGGAQLPATVVGRVPELDLAVIRIESAEPLPTIEIGTSAVPVGLPVVAFGAPLGLQGSVTKGIVSALGREVTVPAGAGTALIHGGVQTDASINPGNSGGPLVGCDAEMIGVNTAIAVVPAGGGGGSVGSVGIGFAIPVELAIAVADQLIANGSYALPSFDMTVVPIPRAAAAEFGLPVGLFVQSVDAGGAAEAAGLQPGDVIVQVDGNASPDETALIRASVQHAVGDPVPVVRVRDGESAEVSVVLG